MNLMPDMFEIAQLAMYELQSEIDILKSDPKYNQDIISASLMTETMFYCFVGEGGGRTGGDNSSAKNGQGGKKTGVVAKSKDEQEATKKSVEQEYQKYIDYDDEGNVIIKDGGKEVAEKDMESNFYRLYILATNDKQLFEAKLVDRNKKVIIQFNGTGSTVPIGTSLQDINDRNWPSTVYGYFLSPIDTQYQSGSTDGIGRSFVDMNSSNRHNYLAHELYFHAYLFLMDRDYRDIYPKVPGYCPQYMNANKPKQK